jgi:HEAT repeat protein
MRWDDVSNMNVRSLFASLVLTASVVAGAAPDPVEDKARLALELGLESKNPDTRKMAVVALSLASANEKLEDQLLHMLDDKDVEVRLATLVSLAEIHDKKAKDAMIKAMDDPVPEVSFAAAKALWVLKEPVGRDALISVLEGESKATSGLFTSKKRETLRMMHTPRTAFFTVVREGAGFVPVPGLGEGVASMQALMNDPNLSGKASAALLLGSDSSQATLAALKDALQDKTASVRAASAHSLALHNDPAFKADLAPLIDDPSESVKLRAAAGYLRLRAIEQRPKPKPAPVPIKTAPIKMAPKKG